MLGWCLVVDNMGAGMGVGVVFIQAYRHSGPIELSKCVPGLCGVVPGSSGFCCPCWFLCTKSWSVLVTALSFAVRIV